MLSEPGPRDRMIATNPKRKTFGKSYKNIQTVHATIQNSSVKLHTARFIGSAVILMATDRFAYILTARHNLYMQAGHDDAPDWDVHGATLATSFRTNVTIRYSSAFQLAVGGEPTNEAAIGAVKPITVTGAFTPWSYDVLLLRSTDAGLLAYARRNAVYSAFPTAAYVKTPSDFLDVSPGLAGRPTVFVQTGFGQIREAAKPRKGIAALPTDDDEISPRNKAGHLQYRVVRSEEHT